MLHQDVAIALGYAVIEGEFKTLCRTSLCPEYLWRRGNPETESGRGVALVYTGDVCPLCDPHGTLIANMRERTEAYRVVSRDRRYLSTDDRPATWPKPAAMRDVCPNVWHMLAVSERATDTCSTCGDRSGL